MRKVIATAVLAVAVALVGATPASGHTAPPCNDSGEPGNSDYAQHHIRALALEGAVGADGHVPGTHQGYSLCLGVHG